MDPLSNVEVYNDRDWESPGRMIIWYWSGRSASDLSSLSFSKCVGSSLQSFMNSGVWICLKSDTKSCKSWQEPRKDCSYEMFVGSFTWGIELIVWLETARCSLWDDATWVVYVLEKDLHLFNFIVMQCCTVLSRRLAAVWITTLWKYQDALQVHRDILPCDGYRMWSISCWIVSSVI